MDTDDIYPRQAPIYTKDSETAATNVERTSAHLEDKIPLLQNKYSSGNDEITAIQTSSDGSSQPIYVRTPIQRWRRRSLGSGEPQAMKGGMEGCQCCIDWTPLCYRVGLRYIWCVRDSCGVGCAIFTWILIFYGQFVAAFVIFYSAPSETFRWINAPLFHTLSTLAFVAHLKAMFCDPGSVPLNNATAENILRMGFREGQVVMKCPRCCSIKPERAHHCSVCRRCISRMDHHCPWINNCVGERNQKYFLLFTGYISFISFYAIYLSVHFFIMCLHSEWQECQGNFGPAASSIFLIFLIMEGLFFGLFTAVMFGDQLQGICSDTTGIENLKKERVKGDRHKRWLNLQVVFGEAMSWRWFFPIRPHVQIHKRWSPMYNV